MFSVADKTGFSLLELMLASVILIIAIGGLLSSYTLCFNINEMAKNQTLSIAVIQERLEDIRDHSFNSIFTDYNNSNFEITGIVNQDAEGSIRVDNSDPDLLKIIVSACWRQQGGRIIGEDNGRGGGIALNGRLDGNEDANANGIMDSPAQIVTLITNK